jgi:hypothetical protein
MNNIKAHDNGNYYHNVPPNDSSHERLAAIDHAMINCKNQQDNPNNHSGVESDKTLDGDKHCDEDIITTEDRKIIAKGLAMKCNKKQIATFVPKYNASTTYKYIKQNYVELMKEGEAHDLDLDLDLAAAAAAAAAATKKISSKKTTTSATVTRTAVTNLSSKVGELQPNEGNDHDQEDDKNITLDLDPGGGRVVNIAIPNGGDVGAVVVEKCHGCDDGCPTCLEDTDEPMYKITLKNLLPNRTLDAIKRYASRNKDLLKQILIDHPETKEDEFFVGIIKKGKGKNHSNKRKRDINDTGYDGVNNTTDIPSMLNHITTCLESISKHVDRVEGKIQQLLDGNVNGNMDKILHERNKLLEERNSKLELSLRQAGALLLNNNEVQATSRVVAAINNNNNNNNTHQV